MLKGDTTVGRRFSAISIVALVACATAAVAVAAATPNFKQGPTCSISGTGTTSATTSCSGTLYGVGVQDVNATTTVSGFAVYTCTNQGGNQAPGQNQVTAGPSTTSTVIPATNAVNGHLTFTTNANTLTVPSTVSGSTAGCPNNNWTGTTPQVTVTSITLTLSQGGTTFYNCTVSNANGLSGTVSFPKSC
jgi:hypothetical protein